MELIEFERYELKENLTWMCQKCLFPYSDSLLESIGHPSDTSVDSDSSSMSGSVDEQNITPGDNNMSCENGNAENGNEDTDDQLMSFPELRPTRLRYRTNLIFGHININSLRYKYTALLEVLYDGLIDVLTVQETKLDPSYSSDQFAVPGYQTYRADRNDKGGGIIVYVRGDIPSRRIPSLEIDRN